MTNDEYRALVKQKNDHIREMRTLVRDLLSYEHVITCGQCKNFRKDHCSYWNKAQADYGYCNFGVRK